MPSFEHTNTQTGSSNEPIYQPGSQESSEENKDAIDAGKTPVPVSQPQATRTGDLQAKAMIEQQESAENDSQPAEKQEDSDVIPKAERNQGHAPTFIDANLPDPGPSILQNRKKDNAQPSKPKRSGLKGRNRGGGSAPATGTKSGAMEFGEVTVGEASESLSGKRVKNGTLVPPAENEVSEEKVTDKKTLPAKSNQPKKNKVERDAQPRQKRERQSREPGSNQKQSEKKPRSNSNKRKNNSGPAKSTPQSKIEEPKTLLGKAKKLLSGLFGSGEPRKMTAPPAQPKTSPKPGNRKPRSKNAHNQGKNDNKRPQGNRPNRRGGRGRGGRGRNQPQGQKRNQDNRKQQDRKE